MSLAAIIRALANAGATPEMLAAAVEASEAEQRERLAEKRAKDAARQRRKRAGVHDVTRSHADADGQGGTPRDPLETKVSPRPPSKTQSPDTPSDPKGSSVPTILPFAKSNGFERFWEAYPSKVGKRDAAKAYDRALKRIAGPDPPQTILAAVADAKLGRRWREGIIPNPSTWLNQDRWEDEIQADESHERPHTSAKFDAKQDNLRRSLAGAISAAQRRGG